MSQITAGSFGAIALFVFWSVLLIPWRRIGWLAMGLAFDNGHTLQAYIFAGSIGSYPVVLLIALVLVLARRQPRFALLPC
jgi:hypothetical protein